MLRIDTPHKPPEPTAAVRYFRVYDSRGRVLADILAERQARRFVRRWNASDLTAGNAARLVGLELVEKSKRRVAR